MALNGYPFVSKFLYFKDNGPVVEYDVDSPPPIAEGYTRVVCISDTHCQHKYLKLPWGHLLVHAGDVLTTSGHRHITRSGSEVKVSPTGKKLLEDFSQWFGSLPHPHKVLVPGNHDAVLEVLGKEEVLKILTTYAKPHTVAYLLYEEATVGPLKVFGSPYSNWRSSNNAFKRDVRYKEMTENTHLMVTHYPPILPLDNGFLENKEIIAGYENNRGLLHVSGHCHWAHGLYYTKKQHLPAVVVPVCDGEWYKPTDLAADPAERGDSEDLQGGGYKLTLLPFLNTLQFYLCSLFLTIFVSLPCLFPPKLPHLIGFVLYLTHFGCLLFPVEILNRTQQSLP